MTSRPGLDPLPLLLEARRRRERFRVHEGKLCAVPREVGSHLRIPQWPKVPLLLSFGARPRLPTVELLTFDAMNYGFNAEVSPRIRRLLARWHGRRRARPVPKEFRFQVIGFFLAGREPSEEDFAILTQAAGFDRLIAWLNLANHWPRGGVTPP